VVKRQNSYAPELEFFGDALDRMKQREGLARQNISTAQLSRFSVYLPIFEKAALKSTVA